MKESNETKTKREKFQLTEIEPSLLHETSVEVVVWRRELVVTVVML